MNWFECKISYEKMQETGSVKKVTESYLVDALSHAEAEARIIEEMKAYISGEFSVSAVRKVKYEEVFISKSNIWWKCKISFISLDEKTGLEKRINVLMLSSGDTVEDAIVGINNGMKGALYDYEVVGINKSNILDIILYDKTV